MQNFIEKELEFGANIYSSLPIVFTHAKGSELYDENGKAYIDMMSAYSAASLGHAYEPVLKTLSKQVQSLGVLSRAVHNNKLPLFLEKVCSLSGLDKAIPMNSGAEAVETAIKVARKWGEKIKGIAPGTGHIIVAKNNFHGRTLAIISFSNESQYKDGFAPYLQGFKEVPFNDIEALEEAITPQTIAFLVEPIQGEAGIVVPSKDYLNKVSHLCKKNNVLLIADEIQCGLSRTGALFCHQHNNILPDLLILGKALGGGIYPVSCVVGKSGVMNVMNPGDHGSTFGGNAIASAIALTSLDELSNPELIDNVAQLGKESMDFLKDQLAQCHHVKSIRGKGLFIGIELTVKAKPLVLQLLRDGVVTKDTHEHTIRIAPALNIPPELLRQALEKIVATIKSI